MRWAYSLQGRVRQQAAVGLTLYGSAPSLTPSPHPAPPATLSVLPLPEHRLGFIITDDPLAREVGAEDGNTEMQVEVL